MQSGNDNAANAKWELQQPTQADDSKARADVIVHGTQLEVREHSGVVSAYNYSFSILLLVISIYNHCCSRINLGIAQRLITYSLPGYLLMDLHIYNVNFKGISSQSEWQPEVLAVSHL